MARRLTDKEALGYLDEIEREVLALRNVIGLLHKRGKFSAGGDGFPSGGSGSGGGSDVSDPTGVAAIRPKEDDRVLTAINSIDERLPRVVDHIRAMRNARTFVMSIEVEERGRQNTIPTCVNPACARSLHDQGPNGRGIAGRCDNCYKFRQANDRDRPVDLIEKERERDSQRRSRPTESENRQIA